jgi:Caspase domain/Glucodextranase, domain B
MRPAGPSRLSLAIATALVLLAPAGAGAQKPSAERPIYAVGDTWTLDLGTYTLQRIDGGAYVYVASPGEEIHFGRDLGITRVVRGGRVELELWPPPAIKWPLQVGAWGITNVSARRNNTPLSLPFCTAAPRFVWRVEAYEDVAVGGATLKAFRIGGMVEAPGLEGCQLARVTTWYAPDPGRIVKLETGGQFTSAFSLRPSALAAAPAAPPTGPGREPSKPRIAEPERPPAPRPVEPSAPTGPGGIAARPGPPAPAPAPGAGSRPAPPPASAPLQVRVTLPADGARLESEAATLAGMVASARGVSRVVVTLNGVEIGRTEEKSAVTSVPLNLALRLREGQNTVVVTATDAGGGTQQEVRTVFYDRPLPLTVEVRYPADQQRVTQDSTVVVVSASSSKGVARVTVTVNGVQAHQQVEKTPAQSVPLTVPITLKPGANAIVVTATQPDGVTRQEVRTVVFDRSSVAAAVPAPAPPPPPAHDQWAVIIGIGRYDNESIPGLRYAVSDAEAIYQVLTATAGFKKDNVLLLTDKTERKPTLRNIKFALGTFLARSAKKDDTVVMFYAGHGAPEVDQRGLERDGLAKYLVPSDADPDDLFSTALPMDDLQTIFGRIESERVVAFLDACYSGAAGGRTFASKKTRASHVDDLFLERLTRSKGRAIVTAARPAEVSVELPELGHGIFTYYLVQALRGAGDLNRDGIVSLQEVYEYLEQQVVRKSRSVGGNQHPVMKGELEGVLPLVKLGPVTPRR